MNNFRHFLFSDRFVSENKPKRRCFFEIYRRISYCGKPSLSAVDPAT